MAASTSPAPAPDRAPVIRRYFAVADTGDYGELARFLHPDLRFRFGNAPPIEGVGQLKALGAQLGDLLAGLEHTVVRVISDVEGRYATVELEVRYTRHDGRVVEVPSTGVFRFDAAGLIDEYRVYVDQEDLFA
jgi:ketosteroid isomerase-like protein